MIPRIRTIAAATVAAATTFTLAACGSNDGDTIKIGTTDAQQKQWQVFEDELEAEGIDAEIVSFADYNLPNQATIDGQVDVTNFQHMLFLAGFNQGNPGSTLTPIGATEIVPLALYYKDGSELADVAKAGEVAIPNDPANQGRAINVLVSSGLVTLKSNAKGLLLPEPADIDTGKSKVKVTPVDAAQTATAYLDGTPAIVNNSFLSNAKIDPTSAVYQDDPNEELSQPYINAFVTTEDKKDDPELQRLVEIWHSEPVQQAINEQSAGTSVEVEMDGEQLSKILADTETKLKKES